MQGTRRTGPSLARPAGIQPPGTSVSGLGSGASGRGMRDGLQRLRVHSSVSSSSFVPSRTHHPQCFRAFFLPRLPEPLEKKGGAPGRLLWLVRRGEPRPCAGSWEGPGERGSLDSQRRPGLRSSLSLALTAPRLSCFLQRKRWLFICLHLECLPSPGVRSQSPLTYTLSC